MEAEKYFNKLIQSYGNQILRKLNPSENQKHNNDFIIVVNSELIFENQKNYFEILSETNNNDYEDSDKDNTSNNFFDFSFSHSIIQNYLLKKKVLYGDKRNYNISDNKEYEDKFREFDFSFFKKDDMTKNFFFDSYNCKNILSNENIIGFPLDEYQGIEYRKNFSYNENYVGKTPIKTISHLNHINTCIAIFIFNEYDLNIKSNFKNFKIQYPDLKINHELDNSKLLFIDFIIDCEKEHFINRNIFNNKDRTSNIIKKGPQLKPIDKNYLYYFINFYCQFNDFLNEINQTRLILKVYFFIDEYEKYSFQKKYTNKKKKVDLRFIDEPKKAVNYFLSALQKYYGSIKENTNKRNFIEFLKVPLDSNFFGILNEDDLGVNNNPYNFNPNNSVNIKFNYLQTRLLITNNKDNILLFNSIYDFKISNEAKDYDKRELDNKVFNSEFIDYFRLTILKLAEEEQDKTNKIAPFFCNYSTKSLELFSSLILEKKIFLNNCADDNFINLIIYFLSKLKSEKVFNKEKNFQFKIRYKRLIKFDSNLSNFLKSGIFKIDIFYTKQHSNYIMLNLENFILNNVYFNYQIKGICHIKDEFLPEKYLFISSIDKKCNISYNRFYLNCVYKIDKEELGNRPKYEFIRNLNDENNKGSKKKNALPHYEREKVEDKAPCFNCSIQ